MLQLVAGLTVVFAGYVLYEVFKTVSQTSHRPPVAGPIPDAAKLPGETTATVEGPIEPKPAPAAPEPVVAAGMEPESVAPAVVTEASPEKPASMLRNPATGETCTVPTNYRFAKKWIKEALVAEGLLDKVYKVADLDEQGSQQVKEAIERLKGIEKYRA